MDVVYRAKDYIKLTPARGLLGRVLSDRWILNESIRVAKGAAQVFTVPAGFTTDLATVPRPLWLITGGKSGAHQRAAVCHDYQCKVREMSSKEAAQMFLDIMHQDGVPDWRAWLMYWAVRLGGPRFKATAADRAQEAT
jgi:hypothetical protein